MREITISFPGKLVFSNGCLTTLADNLSMLGCKRIMIFTITELLPKVHQFIDQLAQHDIDAETDTSIVQEPTFQDFEHCLQKASLVNPDTIVGIGGGSVLDVAKLVAAQLENDQQLQDIVGIGLLKGRQKKLVCVPATSGTGSEASPNAILVDSSNQKKGIISPYLVPDIVYVDPLLTVSVPPMITAATGIDALTHCLEAYTNKFAHPMIDLYAFEGMRLIASHIVRAVKDGSDTEARENVAMGSLYGGFCLGPVNTAGVHALSYPLGSSYHLAHGLSNALLLPYVMEFNLSAAPERYADVAVALGCSRENDAIQTAQKGISKIKSLISECGLPSRLREVNIPKEAIHAMAVDAMNITRLLKNNPRPITLEDAISIYTSAY